MLEKFEKFEIENPNVIYGGDLNDSPNEEVVID